MSRTRPTLAVAGAAALLGAAVGAVAAALGAGAWASVPAVVTTALACTGGLRSLVVRPLEDGVATLLHTARAGDGVRPSEPLLLEVHDALLERERTHGAALAAQYRDLDTLRQVLDSSPLAIALVDGEGRITWVNRTFHAMLRPRADPVGRRPLEVLSIVELHEVVEEVAATSRPAERAATTQSHDLLVRGMVLPSGPIVVRLEDVTTAREAERSRTDFVANVSHELRTPVASILGYLDLALAERERIPDDVVPLLEVALRNGGRLRDLFEDLLKLHRIEARRRELPLERALLAPLVLAAVGPARDKAAMRGQELTVECPPGLEARLNPEALGQILSNLASNASAYSPDGAPIRVVAAAEGSGARIDVIDRGVGIAARHHERIFERFYRVDDARSRKVGGTGLGLAIVKHYAKASQCMVTLRSVEGEGSTFSVHLPG